MKAPWCRVDVLVPATLVLGLALDLGLRALPLDYFSFRAWEALRVGGEAGPFRPNRRYINPAAYGDLANLGNLPGDRVFHAETVSTDAHGYRNPPTLLYPARAVLTGTSFSAGTEVGDEETLAAQLSRVAGGPVYNAALSEWDFETLRDILRRQGITSEPGGRLRPAGTTPSAAVADHPARGVLVFEYLEGRGPPSIMVARDRAPVGRCPQAFAGLPGVCNAYNRLVERWRVSPLRVLTARLLRRLQNDRWLPNPYRDVVTRTSLPDGSAMLFESSEWKWELPRTDEERIVRYFQWLERRLRLEEVELLVVLAPKKHTVYGPLLERRRDGESGAQSLARIEAGLARARVPVVNLTEPLRAAAAVELAAGRYVYFLDDTHWNAAGIAEAARAIAPRLRRMLAP